MNTNMSLIKNEKEHIKVNFKSPSLYLNDFRIIDMTCISGENLLNEEIVF